MAYHIPRPTHRDRFERHECKYLISEAIVVELQRFIAPYVEPDPYTGGQRSYLVNTLYLDTPDLRLYRETVEGIGNRFKLRARSYGHAPILSADPVFLEIKSRRNNLVHKSRARISGFAFRAVLAGQAPDVQRLPERALKCYDEFVSWVGRLGARPIVHVRYDREAWVGSFHEGIRVTIDRDIRCASAESGVRADELDLAWNEVERRWLVLELKFDVAFPLWMRELVHRFQLKRLSFSKYGNAVQHSLDPILHYLA